MTRLAVSSTTLRLVLDAVVLGAIAVLLSPRLTGLPLHEWIGLSFGLPVLAHLLFSWPWITRSTRNLFVSATPRQRVNYILNALLFVLTVIEIFSGIVISQVALPRMGIATINDRSWRALHNQTLNWFQFVVGLHIAMNWQWILRALRKRLPISVGSDLPSERSSTRVASIAAASVFVLLAAALVCSSAFLLLGRPSAQRVYIQDEIARFAPTLGHGIGQFIGEASLLCLVAFIGHRWLKVRL